MPRGILEPALRRNAHGGIHGSAAVNRAHGRASAQMTAHHAQIGLRTRQDLGRTLAYVLMRGPMESIACDTRVTPYGWHSISRRVPGKIAMELRLERSHQRRP